MARLDYKVCFPVFVTSQIVNPAVTSGAGPRAVGMEAGGVNDNERHLRHSPVSSPTEELRKDKRRSDDSGRRERTRPGL